MPHGALCRAARSARCRRDRARRDRRARSHHSAGIAMLVRAGCRRPTGHAARARPGRRWHAPADCIRAGSSPSAQSALPTTIESFGHAEMRVDASEINDGRRRWQERYDAARRRDADFTTLSGVELAPVYGPPAGTSYDDFERIGWPGEFPFTRGLYPTGYRGRTWTIRQFAGFGNAQQTNE